VPLDDRPVTLQLPKMLGAIAGVRVATPPRPLLGNYLEPGDPAALLHWLHDEAPRDASAYIVSTDMLDFGGLVASRAPGTPPYVAETRLRDLAAFRAQRPAAAFALFGTVMRLAPTGVPALGAAADFFAAGQPVDWLTQYANLPDPPQTPEQKALAAKLAGQLGGDLPAYLATRARDRDVDLYALQLTAENAFDRIVIGQDDAGPVGLHLRDLAALHSFARRWLPPGRADIEPGADELGMILTGAELAREAHVVPRVRVRYSRAGGGSVQDPLEFAPVDTTIGDIIRACGAVRAPDGDAHADIDLFVRVPGTSAADESAFVDAIAAETADGANGPRPAVADLTFLDAGDLDEQRALVEAMIARGIAGKIDAFASWNTTANTIGDRDARGPRDARLRSGHARAIHARPLRRRLRLPRFRAPGGQRRPQPSRHRRSHLPAARGSELRRFPEPRRSLAARADAAVLDLPALPRHGPDDHPPLGPHLRNRTRRPLVIPSIVEGQSQSMIIEIIDLVTSEAE
jgi:hypothetical protein